MATSPQSYVPHSAMFPALYDSMKPPPVYTPAPQWIRGNTISAAKRTKMADNALHVGSSIFSSGDLDTVDSSGTRVGPGGALSLAYQSGLLAGRDNEKVWISGSVDSVASVNNTVALTASRSAGAEFWLCTDSNVSIINHNLCKVANLSSKAAIDCCAAAEHPRVCILGGESIFRADVRMSYCEEIKPGKPPVYYAGWLTDWDGSGIYQWSAISINPQATFLLAAASQRYRSLAIFDLRKACSPLSEWSLPLHPSEFGVSMKGMEWSADGTELLVFGCRSSRAFAVSMAGRREPLFSHIELIEHDNPIMGACFNDIAQGLNIYDSKSCILEYQLKEFSDPVV